MFQYLKSGELSHSPLSIHYFTKHNSHERADKRRCDGRADDGGGVDAAVLAAVGNDVDRD